MTNLDPNPSGVIPEFTLGDRLRKARTSARLEQQELAAEIDVHRQSIARYENDIIAPKRHVILAWSRATGVDEGWIVGVSNASTHVEQPTRSTV